MIPVGLEPAAGDGGIPLGKLQILSDHEVLVSPRFSLDDAREILSLDIGESEADTIGGLVYERLGEIPKAGDRLLLGKATLTVDSVRGQRIQSMRITSPDPLIVHPTRNGDHEESREEPRAAHG